MTVLCRPSLFIHGRFEVDPPTANNNNQSYILDSGAVALTASWAAKTDAEAMSALTTLQTMDDGTEDLPSYWNFYGSNGFKLVQAQVTGGFERDGTTPLSDDSVLGAQVDMAGHSGTGPVMFQLDPVDAISAQIICASLTLASGSDSVARLSAANPSRAHLRDLYPFRLPGTPDNTKVSATFQTTVDSGDVHITAGDSSSLQAFADALAEGRDLVFLYCLYNCGRPVHDAQQLAAAYARDERPNNPRTGDVIGRITTAPKGALRSQPAGRRLRAPAAQWLAAQPGPGAGARVLGPAYVEVDSTVEDHATLTLNTISTIPEVLNGSTVEKVDLGELIVGVSTSDGFRRLRSVAAETYAEYGRNAGCFAWPLTVAELKDVEANPLELRFGDSPLQADECEYLLATDDRNVCLDAGDTTTLEVRVTHLGRPAPGVDVIVGPWQSGMSAPGARATDGEDTGPGFAPWQSFRSTSAVVKIPMVTTDANGVASVEVQTGSAGSTMVVFWVRGTQSPPQDMSFFECDRCFYSGVRVLPDDSGLAAQEATWPTVYETVLRPYALLYPVMNEIFRLDDPEAVKGHADQILKVIDPAAWETTLYMPISRDLSRGRRDFLTRWLNTASDANRPTNEDN